MGPVYIKIGQIISTRTDIFPSYVTNSLSELQNDVKYMRLNEVYDIFEKDFENDIDTYFSDFSIEPIASASIGQVLSLIHI